MRSVPAARPRLAPNDLDAVRRGDQAAREMTAAHVDAHAASASPTPFATLSSKRGAVLAALAAASVIVTSTAGRLITAKPVKGWYTTLHKPSFNPPNWAFPVAWTLLFLLMAVAFWRVLRTPVDTPLRPRAIRLFIAQLFLNVGWSAAFFGANSALLGMIVIVPFWLLIVFTARTFAKIDAAAGWLLTPYIAWVAFATVLNGAILVLN